MKAMNLLATLILVLGSIFAPTAFAVESDTKTSNEDLKPISCAANKSRKERSRMLDEYVKKVEDTYKREFDSTEKTVAGHPYEEVFRAFAPHLMPEEITFDTKCWAAFFEAQRELKDGHGQLAYKKSVLWMACLETYKDELGAKDSDKISTQFKPILSCFVPSAAAPVSKNPTPESEL